MNEEERHKRIEDALGRFEKNQRSKKYRPGFHAPTTKHKRGKIMEEIQKLMPKEAIRAYCMQCLGMKQLNTDQVKDCQGDQVKCSFFPYRLGKRPPVKVFRKFCLQDCMNGYRGLVADCTTKDCPNHPYRMGTNPALIGKRKQSPGGMVALQNFNKRHRDDAKNNLVSIFP